MQRYVPDYVIFDLETTGLSQKKDRIVEIAGVKVRSGVVTEEFSTLVHPGMPIPYAASRVNHITDDMVREAPSIEKALGDFLRFVGDLPLAGHNIASFDMGFIRRDCMIYGYDVPKGEVIDTLRIAKEKLPGMKHSLTELAAYYGIPTGGAHRALNDCRMNQKVYEALTADLKKSGSETKSSGILLRGVVERITFQNPENGFSVLRCAVKDYADLVTVVGNLLDVNVGSVLLLRGFWRVDPKFGRQFSAESWEETLPATVYGIEKYLGSGLIKGVGPKFAKRIVQLFGTDTLNVIETDVQRLMEVEGIGRKRVEMIARSWEAQKEIKNVMLFLQEHGVSTAFAAKIYRTYGNESIDTVKKNPYRLADDIWGIGFKTADAIAEKLGFAKDCYVRLRAGLMYTLSELGNEGHVYALRQQLLDKGVQLLESEEEKLRETLNKMLKERDVILQPTTDEGEAAEAIYLPPFYYAEVGCASALERLMKAPGEDRLWVSLSKAREKNPSLNVDVGRIEEKLSMTYDEIQADAIRRAALSKVMVLTGGPGTGKTTTLQGIITAYSMYGLRILLAAPTGRAAKRMSEATGLEAKTIHRLLEFKPPSGYEKNEEHPLEGDVLILDECSMIDVVLMNALLKAIPSGMRLILVGDTDQLPSVGAGNVLQDLIDCGQIPVVRLTRIFRQAQASRIIMNAHRINEGKMPDLSNGKHTDFFFIEEEDQEKVRQQITTLVKEKLPSYYKIPSAQIQVLTPMQRGVAGSLNMNLSLQEALNPGTEGLRRGGIQYRAGDKVMQIRNNYDKEVFNGDIGIVEKVDLQDRNLTVDFDDRKVLYDSTELDELSLAYSTTIHKAQGSEFPIVVMPVLMAHFVMLQRNLIYTGITRARKILVIVGSRKALSMAVRNQKANRRNTLLAGRLRGEIRMEEVRRNL